jgi:hypothetical protein
VEISERREKGRGEREEEKARGKRVNIQARLCLELEFHCLGEIIPVGML